MSRVEERLEALAEDMGVRLVETGRLSMEFNACFHAPTKTIFIRHGLDPVTRRCAIAHELGHAHAGDTCSSSRAEWAASNLLDLDEVEAVAMDVDHAPSAMAAELGVTPNLLAVWMRLYEAGRIRAERDCLDPAR